MRRMRQKKLWKSLLTVFTCFTLIAPLSVNAAESTNEQKLKDGSYVFFEDRGSSEALEALNNSQYASYTVKGDEADATSFKNMLAAIEWIKECNQLRALNNLDPLLVSDRLMAMAQADANYSDMVTEHARQFNVGENLAWNTLYTTPFIMWYDNEKEIYDQTHERTPETGHYLNIIEPSYKTTGFAINTRGTNYPYTFAQVFSGADDGIPVEEYEKQLLDYYDSLKPADNESGSDTPAVDTTPSGGASTNTTPSDQPAANTQPSSESQTASTETGDVNKAAVTANNAAFGEIVGNIKTDVISGQDIQLIVVNGQEKVMELASEEQKAALAKVFGVSDPQKALVNLFKELVRKNAAKVEVVAVADISLQEGFEIPADGIRLDINVDSSVGIKKGAAEFYIFHLTKESVWEYIPSEATADNVLTATFKSLSPVYIVKAEGVADITNDTATNNNNTNTNNTNTNNTNTNNTNTSNTNKNNANTNNIGAATGDVSLIWIVAVLAAGGALAVFSRKRIVR